ncbi:MAG: ABC transporter ATP-binding protein/permease [Chloroflexota bacterium]|nr:ABC transporter ATP-binding protein/permease [Chloroflexota bacterium]
MQAQGTQQGQRSGRGAPAAGPPSATAGGRGGRPKADPGTLLRAIRYVGHYRRLALLAYGSLFVATAAQLAVPQLVQNMIDAVVNAFIANQVLALPAAVQPAAAQRLGLTLAQVQANSSGATAALATVMLGVVAFAIVRALFAFSQSYNAERVSQSVAYDFRRDLFSKISRLSFSYHDKNQTGQLMIRATDDVEKLRLFIGQGLLLALQAVVLLVGTLIILGFTNFGLMLVVLPILPVAMVVFMIFGAVSQPLFRTVQQRLSRLNTILQENMAGLKVVKAFAREPQEEQRFNEAADLVLDQQLRVSRIFAFLFPLIFLLANVGQAAILYFGGVQIIGNTLTLGEWQKFSLYLVYVFFPLGQLGFIINLMAQASASAQRIFEILDAQNEVENKPGALDLREVHGDVTFEDVTFRYFKGGEPVLSQVSLTAHAGQTIALLGATGSGKTTIINLIPRFYDASEGRVTLDGHDVRDLTLESLRAQIGIVLQETTLFGGTIRDNIAFGRPDATDAEVIAAAQAAAAHEFISAFPGGYSTPVGERGSTLSGGQKQRIAIARALLLNPRILILDDSTSSVDLTTEYRIQQALDRLMEGRTSFVIAQRISTVLNADQILVLDKGQIVARGTHEELLESSEIYSEIYSSQLLDDSAGEAVGASNGREKVGVAV